MSLNASHTGLYLTGKLLLFSGQIQHFTHTLSIPPHKIHVHIAATLGSSKHMRKRGRQTQPFDLHKG